LLHNHSLLLLLLLHLGQGHLLLLHPLLLLRLLLHTELVRLLLALSDVADDLRHIARLNS